jgi:hypothetical protein
MYTVLEIYFRDHLHWMNFTERMAGALAVLLCTRVASETIPGPEVGCPEGYHSLPLVPL